MKAEDIAKIPEFTLLNEGDDPGRELTKVYICDLLSFAMGRAPAGSAWITVMSNVNTLAVASLADVSAVVLAEEVTLDETTRAKAEMQGITVYSTTLSAFDAGLAINEAMKA